MNGNITQYSIRYSKSNSKNFNLKETNGDVKTFEITELEPSTEYEIAVAAVTVDRGPFTNRSLRASTTGTHVFI